ncbi:beta-galactosidase [Streptomyces atroolivaceus]|uniref:beta-galactosidase n=1 Tax=Streptomyces atroolivaceus TaxID=66869 RepID=A0ABV9VK36_STRAZ|nr:beta-galactosidase [Streptomyces atroolivaceus]
MTHQAERSESSPATLYVGANYHPHDSDPRQWERDVRMMKEAGLTVVRLGHLAWDSFEPADGQFEFTWFDDVMDLMHDAGIGVILDIAVRPAPLWLHRKHPSISITDSTGNRLYPNTRYMVDVGDPAYREHALRFADTLTRRYAAHPALLAFGVDNEPGDGPYSYSETVRSRFVSWLRGRYSTVEKLNHAWAGQRWSRRIGDFDEVGLPVSGRTEGAPERLLDFRRFVSCEINEFLLSVISRVEENAPEAHRTGNSWYYTEAGRYFDYAEIAYSGRMDRDGMGFYPGPSLVDNTGLHEALLGIARIRLEADTPFWCTEFTTMTAAPGSVRKSAYASLLMGNQMVCGWTWQTMHGGEEQYLQGMVDWDGEPNRKCDEYRQLAKEFAKIQDCGFPYRSRAEIGLAFSFPSQLASAFLPEKHDVQLQTCFDAVLDRNLDQRVVDVSRSSLQYQILLLPGVALMDEESAARIRRFVADGGTAVMTSYSASVDVTGQVFATARPGLLGDVFGIRIGSYQEPHVLNELAGGKLRGEELDIVHGDRHLRVEAPRIDEIHPRTARVAASAVGLDRDYPVVTVNAYGKGRAIYVGAPARRALIDIVLDSELELRGIRPDLTVPPGVLARAIDATHLLYVNLEGESKAIATPGPSRSVLHDHAHADDGFTLAPFDSDLVELFPRPAPSATTI